MLQNIIRSKASQYAPEYIDVRRHLHAHPELSYEEFETSAFVQEKLKSLGIPFTIMAETGVIGVIEGKNPTSRVVALRADMDALPITEENDIPYKSTKPGVMHACGHDVHTTCLLGAARILAETKDQWEGTVKLLFQPGEERNPGGASLLIKEGALQNPAPARIFGLHVNPQLEVGLVSFRGGKVMASADELYITIKGPGGHAAAPNWTVDTILVASHIVVALQQVISRNNHPLSPSVLTISAFNGGYTTNVIPSEVKLMGTFRAMDEEWRFKAHEIIRRVVTGTAEAMGAQADVHIDEGYPTVYNNEALSLEARHLAEGFLGAERVQETEIRMGAEDFGYYSQVVPGCFYRLGTANKAKGITAGVHTPNFNIDESAIETGVGLMALFGAMG
ncbi:M20 metallopeptidase family protein [Flaviaesturariibacter aridisoli]|uniref:Amidohydrolase n=1 Tax=Flaviaesturariibacter aridisoli TaxID=2545761 RepID=A0A4R4E1G2_9BACT|nr:M20 family metallopeptidase [Flaviaesturariibacter aridisoli]TCZ68570.1 amidohydrolase [Flaviaesturariibacter aridisoli]